MPLNQHGTAVHAYVLMRGMKLGERFDIPAEALKDMIVPREHPLDTVDARYVVKEIATVAAIQDRDSDRRHHRQGHVLPQYSVAGWRELRAVQP